MNYVENLEYKAAIPNFVISNIFPKIQDINYFLKNHLNTNEDKINLILIDNAILNYLFTPYQNYFPEQEKLPMIVYDLNEAECKTIIDNFLEDVENDHSYLLPEIRVRSNELNDLINTVNEQLNHDEMFQNFMDKLDEIIITRAKDFKELYENELNQVNNLSVKEQHKNKLK